MEDLGRDRNSLPLKVATVRKLLPLPHAGSPCLFSAPLFFFPRRVTVPIFRASHTLEKLHRQTQTYPGRVALALLSELRQLIKLQILIITSSARQLCCQNSVSSAFPRLAIGRRIRMFECSDVLEYTAVFDFRLNPRL